MKSSTFSFIIENLTIKKTVYTFLLLLVFINLDAQVYVHPNQPGRKGGNTMPSPASYNQVATTTYKGTNGSTSLNGALKIADKNPATGTLNQNGRVLYFFKGTPDASYSYYTTPFTASDGNLYGPSSLGGTNGLGAVYKFDVASAQGGTCTGNESIIYNLGGSGGSYGNYSNLNELSDDMLYLPETAGGTSAYGKMTKMTKTGASPTNIHNFVWNSAGTNSSLYSAGAQQQPGFSTYGLGVFGIAYDGAYPYGFPVEGPDGFVYGTTLWGGLGGLNQGYGTVYKMKKDGTGYQILAFGSSGGFGTYNTADGSTVANIIYPFAIPWGNVAIDEAGVYGYFFGGYVTLTTYGDICRVKLDGSEQVQIVHRLLPTGSATQPQYLYRGPTIVGNELFGTSYAGGTGGGGTVFKIDLSKLNPSDNPIDANGINNTLQVLHNFSTSEGFNPYAGLVYDGTFLYGSTQGGGSMVGVSSGTIYKIKPDGTAFQYVMDFKNQTNTCPANTPVDQQVFNVYTPSSERITLLDMTNTSCNICIENPTTTNPCSAAPTLVCPGEVYTLTITDNTLIGIQWFKDGVAITGANALTYDATMVGTYTYTAQNASTGCAVDQCCPIVLSVNPNCCKPKICLPVTVKVNK